MKISLCISFALACGLSGCADNPKVRTLAVQIGTFSTANKAATDDFKVRWDRYNQQLQRRSTLQDAQALETQHSVERQRDLWVLGPGPRGAPSDRRADMLATYMKSTPDLIYGKLTTTIVAVPVLDAGNFDGQMTIGISAAAALSKKPSTLDSVKALAGIYGTVHDTLKDLKTKAAADGQANVEAN